MNRALIALIAGLSAVAPTGCGSSATPPPFDAGSEDGNQLAKLLDDFNEAKYSQAKLKPLFAGPLPAHWKKYDPYACQLDGKPSVAGDAATAKVALRHDDGTQKSAEWSFAKDGGQWKVKAAPLP